MERIGDILDQQGTRGLKESRCFFWIFRINGDFVQNHRGIFVFCTQTSLFNRFLEALFGFMERNRATDPFIMENTEPVQSLEISFFGGGIHKIERQIDGVVGDLSAVME